MRKSTAGIGMLFDKAIILCFVFLVGVVPGEETHNFPASGCRILCGHYLLDCGFFYGAIMPKRGDVHPETGLVYWDKSNGVERWRDAATIEMWMEKVRSARSSFCYREKKKIAAAKYRAENPSKRKEYYSRNKSRELASNRDWRNADNPKYIAYSERAKAKAPERARRYLENNREKIYRRANEKRRNNASLKILGSLRNRLFCALRRAHGIPKSKRTIEYLGCSIEFLKDYLAAKFSPGMSWDNYGKSGWHIDHIKPCSMFDLTKKEEQDACFHYSNLQPLWAIDNSRKGARWIG